MLDAIREGNRAEAWYQIRYNSQTTNPLYVNGIANRRYSEADIFGLYDTGIYTVEESKEIMRMYTRYADDILDYETDYPPSASIEWEIGAAKNFLANTFATQYIDGQVIVGAGLDSYAYLESNPDDIIAGTDKNDLIFGEKGTDTAIKILCYL